MLPKFEPERQPVSGKRPYSAPKLTELGNVDTDAQSGEISPELKATLLAMKESLKRDTGS